MSAPVFGPVEKPSVFRGMMRDPRDVQAPDGSQNAELLALRQRRRFVGDPRGHLFLRPRTGLVVMPISAHAAPRDPETGELIVPLPPSTWRCIVVDGAACTDESGRVTYPRGGHDISVSELELTTAIDLTEGEGEWTAEGLHRPTVEAVLAALRTVLAATPADLSMTLGVLAVELDGSEPIR